MRSREWAIGDDKSTVAMMLDDRHELSVHITDEGVVLDVWDTQDENAAEVVWSTYHFDTEMIEDEEGANGKR